MMIGVGVVIAIASFTDFTILLFSPDLSSTEWRLNFMTQVIDRGIIPLMGFALILWGFWIQAYCGFKSRLRKPLLTSIFLLAGLLGAMYFGLTLFHLSDANQAKFEAIQRLEQQAKNAEQQLDNRLSQEVNVINNLVGNPDQLQQQLQGQILTSDQQEQLNQLLAQLDQYKKDPQALRERTAKTRDQGISLIRQQKEEAEKQIRISFRRSAVHIPLSSLMLTIGYLSLAFFGFQSGNRQRS
jgi:hypothetical protein